MNNRYFRGKTIEISCASKVFVKQYCMLYRFGRVFTLHFEMVFERTYGKKTSGLFFPKLQLGFLALNVLSEKLYRWTATETID